MGEERLIKRAYRENVGGNRKRGRPQGRLVYKVKDLLLGERAEREGGNGAG